MSGVSPEDTLAVNGDGAQINSVLIGSPAIGSISNSAENLSFATVSNLGESAINRNFDSRVNDSKSGNAQGQSQHEGENQSKCLFHSL